jgi:NitT/TauT family transport system substrate-binding protein
MYGDASKITLTLPRLRRRSVTFSGLAALGLAACGQPNSTPAVATSAPSAPSAPLPTSQPTARPIEKFSLRLSWIKNTEFAGFFVAQEKGYFKDEAIDLTINGSAQNLPEVQAVAGKTDLIGLSGGQSLMLARAQGVPVKAIGALFQKGPGAFVWLEKSGITGIKDFKGKKIGHQQTARASTEAMLVLNGLSPDDVSLQPIGFDIQPLLTGQVDVLTGLVTNQVVTLEQEGQKVGFAPYSDLGFGFYWNTPFVTDETFNTKKDLLASWMRASARGWDYALKNPDEVAKLVVDKYGEGLDLTNQTIELKRETALISTPFTKDKGLFWMDKAVWQSGADILLNRTKQVEKAVNVDEVMSLDILSKVGKIGG